MPAGELRERVAFDKRGSGNDGYGNRTTAFAEQFVVAAGILPMKGGEAVLASRLARVQPVIIQVSYSSQTKLIGTDWRARDVRSGTIYNIKSIANMDRKKQYLDIMAVSGEAA